MNTDERMGRVSQDLYAVYARANKLAAQYRDEAKKAEMALRALGNTLDGGVVEGARREEPHHVAAGKEWGKRGPTQNTLAAAKIIADELRKGPMQHKDLLALGRDLSLSSYTINNILRTGPFKKEDGKFGKWSIVEAKAEYGGATATAPISEIATVKS